MNDVRITPTPMMSAPAPTTGRGPKRSARDPVSGPSRKEGEAVIEKIAEVASRVAPNSSAIGLKNAPKLYARPNTVKQARNPAATVTQARVESRVSPITSAGLLTLRDTAAYD